MKINDGNCYVLFCKRAFSDVLKGVNVKTLSGAKPHTSFSVRKPVKHQRIAPVGGEANLGWESLAYRIICHMLHDNLNVRNPFLNDMRRSVLIYALVFIILCGGGLVTM